MTTPIHSIEEMTASQYDAYLTFNSLAKHCVAKFFLTVEDKDLTSPPAHSDGATWIVGPASTGAWAGHDDEIAHSYDAAWSFYVQQEGWLAYVRDEEAYYVFTTVWELLILHTVQTGYTTSNVTTDRVLNADSTTLDEVADVLCTLIEDLKTKGLISA